MSQQKRNLDRTLDKKRAVVLLRSVVVVAVSYLILFGPHGRDGFSIAYIVCLIVSSGALACLPGVWFNRSGFAAGLLIVDTAAVLVGLYLTAGCFSQDFLILYFFTIFLTTATQGLVQIAAAASLVSALYGYWLWISTPQSLGPEEWLRLPFFFIVAIFYAYMTEDAKVERQRREQSERETAHLRALLQMTEGGVQWAALQEMADHLLPLIEAVFPRLRCGFLAAAAPQASEGQGHQIFPLRAMDQTFGVLDVNLANGTALSTEEEQFCRLVAQVAANALYTAQQVQSAGAGQHAKQQFLGTLSHELRSPVHAILGYTDILHARGIDTGDEFVCESCDRLRSIGVRLQRMVEDLLTLTQLRAGAGQVRVEPVELRPLFADLARVIEGQLSGRPVVFAYEVDSDLPPVRSDRGKLRQLVLALLTNAAKFTERGAVVLEAGRAEDGGVTIAVRDSGIGIDERDVPTIFEDFRQLDGSPTRRFDGLGLGLMLARDLARTLGGRIDVQSAVGAGATFRVWLPLAGPPTELDAPVTP